MRYVQKLLSKLLSLTNISQTMANEWPDPENEWKKKKQAKKKKADGFVVSDSEGSADSDSDSDAPKKSKRRKGKGKTKKREGLLFQVDVSDPRIYKCMGSDRYLPLHSFIASFVTNHNAFETEEPVSITILPKIAKRTYAQHRNVQGCNRTCR